MARQVTRASTVLVLLVTALLGGWSSQASATNDSDNPEATPSALATPLPDPTPAPSAAPEVTPPPMVTPAPAVTPEASSTPAQPTPTPETDTSAPPPQPPPTPAAEVQGKTQQRLADTGFESSHLVAIALTVIAVGLVLVWRAEERAGRREPS